jgi:hypothetical protein
MSERRETTTPTETRRSWFEETDSNAMFVQAQRILMNLYENGHKKDSESLERSMDSLLGHVKFMVKKRKLENET